jgi:hypothetical protein
MVAIRLECIDHNGYVFAEMACSTSVGIESRDALRSVGM